MKKICLVALPMAMLAVSFPQTSHAFGERWGWASCNKCSRAYTHTGTDIKAAPGQKVTVTADDLFYITKGTDGDWKSYVVMEDANHKTTYVVWHLEGVGSFKKGENMKGKTLGRVADLKNTTDHVHIGFRYAQYNPSLSIKRALPSCNHKPKGLPQFPEAWRSPYVKIKIG